jgi:hypothetical protein
MRIEDARKRMRELDEEYHCLLPCEGSGPAISSDDLSEETNAQLEENRREKERLGQVCAGFPHIRPHLWCWMVDVHGTESNLCDDEAFGEGIDLLQENDGDGFASRAGGAMMQQVRRYITEELGMRITDSGGGCGGWHLGTPCGEAEMQTLTAALHGRFAKAVAAGLISVQVKFWKWRFREVTA